MGIEMDIVFIKGEPVGNCNLPNDKSGRCHF